MKVFREDGGELLRLYDRKGGKIRQNYLKALYLICLQICVVSKHFVCWYFIIFFSLL